MLHKYNGEHMNEFNKCPGAPKKRKFSETTEELFDRWSARKVVRELFPVLTPKDPEYFKQVDRFTSR